MLLFTVVGSRDARNRICMHNCLWNEHNCTSILNFIFIEKKLCTEYAIIRLNLNNFFHSKKIYPEEKIRSQMIGIILGSMALGVLLGYPFGGILYAFIGKSAPFFIISFLTLIIFGKSVQISFW